MEAISGCLNEIGEQAQTVRHMQSGIEKISSKSCTKMSKKYKKANKGISRLNETNKEQAKSGIKKL